VGENMKNHPGVFFANLKKVLPKKGLPSQHNDQMDSHLFGFVQNAMDLLCLQFSFFRVVPCIAAITMKIAPHGGTDEHGPGRVKSCSRCKILSSVRSLQKLVDQEMNQLLALFEIGFAEDSPRNFEGGVVSLEESSNPFNFHTIRILLGNLFSKASEADEILFRTAGKQRKSQGHELDERYSFQTR
jgi:hypothetical protein